MSPRLLVAGTTVSLTAAAHLLVPGLRPLWLALLLLGLLAATRAPAPRLDRLGRVTSGTALLLGPAVSLVAVRASGPRQAALLTPGLLLVLVLVLGPVLLWSARAVPRPERPALAPLVGIGLSVAVCAAVVLSGPPRIDVHVALTEGAANLLQGVDPYAATTTNVYTAQELSSFYGPGFLVDGRVPYGFPYPPLLLLLAVPGHLLGDVRWTGVALLALTSLVVLGRGSDPRRRLAAVLLVAGPGTWFVVQQSWTEVWILPLAVLAHLALRRGRWATAAVLVGALLVSKQYLVAALPLLWLLRPVATPRRAALLLGTAALLTVPWVAADPAAFLHSVVAYQTATPLRHDSFSLLVEVVDRTGLRDSGWLRAVPLVAGLAVAAVLARRGRGRPDLLVALALAAVLVTVLLGKQAFVNYFWLVGAGWTCLAGLAGPGTVASGPQAAHGATDGSPYGVAAAGTGEVTAGATAR